MSYGGSRNNSDLEDRIRSLQNRISANNQTLAKYSDMREKIDIAINKMQEAIDHLHTAFDRFKIHYTYNGQVRDENRINNRIREITGMQGSLRSPILSTLTSDVTAIEQENSSLRMQISRIRRSL